MVNEMEGELGRRDSRKRRRLSERRRVFSRIGNLAGNINPSTNQASQRTSRLASMSSLSTEQSSWSSSATQHQQQHSASSRSDSPVFYGDGAGAGGGKIQMKIQFHITVAPENEPLILSNPVANHQLSSWPSSQIRQSSHKSTESIGDQIHERLSRQSTLSTRRRQQLLALHQQTALGRSSQPTGEATANQQVVGERPDVDSSHHSRHSNIIQSEDNIMLRSRGSIDLNHQASRRPSDEQLLTPSMGGRDQGARSSTITGGMADEATVRFLAQQQAARPISTQMTLNDGGPVSSVSRENIYFKRDGQRFGHEFTLKLAIDRTYRCLLKVRPLVPLQAISVQGHQTLFVDCSQTSANLAASRGSATSSAPASSAQLNHNSWHNIHTISNHLQHRPSVSSASQHKVGANHRALNLHHALTTNSISQNRPARAAEESGQVSLYRQQQSQMMRSFAASHCSSSSNSHLGSQLIYMFDWSAARFDVNKNKNRTQIQTVLKFRNGQILSLPLQVKFYQPECRQHLNWGSQLHFIDYECTINNNTGHISVDRVQYY